MVFWVGLLLVKLRKVGLLEVRGFVDKSFVRRRWLLTSAKRRLLFSGFQCQDWNFLLKRTNRKNNDENKKVHFPEIFHWDKPKTYLPFIHFMSLCYSIYIVPNFPCFLRTQLEGLGRVRNTGNWVGIEHIIG